MTRTIAWDHLAGNLRWLWIALIQPQGGAIEKTPVIPTALTCLLNFCLKRRICYMQMFTWWFSTTVSNRNHDPYRVNNGLNEEQGRVIYAATFSAAVMTNLTHMQRQCSVWVTLETVWSLVWALLEIEGMRFLFYDNVTGSKHEGNSIFEWFRVMTAHVNQEFTVE